LNMPFRFPIVTIQGPTAVGKSDLAFKLAKYLSTDIISADSRQVYKLLDIGTAKPNKKKLQLVRHHLINKLFPDEQYNAGDFCLDARKIIYKMNKQNKLPLIVGGTGFYIKALIGGLAKIPPIPFDIKLKIRKLYQQHPGEYLHQKLKKIDPESAQRIESNDIQKISRALEVYESTGKTISSFWEQQQPVNDLVSYDILLTDKRENIYKKIDRRLDKMLENGLLNEIENLLKAGYKEDDPGMITVGYREFYPYFKNQKSSEKCLEEAKKNSRNYAKRQFTWFKKIDFDLTLTPNRINFFYVLKMIREFFVRETE